MFQEIGGEAWKMDAIHSSRYYVGLLRFIQCQKNKRRSQEMNKENVLRVRLDCPAVTYWDVVITVAFQIRFQIRGQFWIPQPKLHGACYLIFLVKPQNGLV